MSLRSTRVFFCQCLDLALKYLGDYSNVVSLHEFVIHSALVSTAKSLKLHCENLALKFACHIACEVLKLLGRVIQPELRGPYQAPAKENKTKMFVM